VAWRGSEPWLRVDFCRWWLEFYYVSYYHFGRYLLPLQAYENKTPFADHNAPADDNVRRTSKPNKELFLIDLPTQVQIIVLQLQKELHNLFVFDLSTSGFTTPV
jgi:hypothetical protein